MHLLCLWCLLFLLLKLLEALVHALCRPARILRVLLLERRIEHCIEFLVELARKGIGLLVVNLEEREDVVEVHGSRGIQWRLRKVSQSAKVEIGRRAARNRRGRSLCGNLCLGLRHLGHDEKLLLRLVARLALLVGNRLLLRLLLFLQLLFFSLLPQKLCEIPRVPTAHVRLDRHNRAQLSLVAQPVKVAAEASLEIDDRFANATVALLLNVPPPRPLHNDSLLLKQLAAQFVNLIKGLLAEEHFGRPNLPLGLWQLEGRHDRLGVCSIVAGAFESLWRNRSVLDHKVVERDLHRISHLANAHNVQHAAVPQLRHDHLAIKHIRHLLRVGLQAPHIPRRRGGECRHQ
eukprot:Opistho-2@64334